jgi:hypothetical protein
MDIDLEPVAVFAAPIYLRYHATSARAVTPFLHALKRGVLIGHRSPGTGKVLFPPLGSCPESGLPTSEEVVLADTGTIISFTTVHLAIPGSKLKPPFTVANITLDGADQFFSHLVSGCALEDVVIGMRVRAKWRPPSEWGYSLENIEYFVPTGEPTVDIPRLKAERLRLAREHRHA